jgi:hypothetical protein
MLSRILLGRVRLLLPLFKALPYTNVRSVLLVAELLVAEFGHGRR